MPSAKLDPCDKARIVSSNLLAVLELLSCSEYLAKDATHNVIVSAVFLARDLAESLDDALSAIETPKTACSCARCVGVA